MELIDIVDENNNLTGETLERWAAYYAGLWKRTVSCWIMNENGEVLLQKRTANKVRNPNKWAKTGGQVDSGETAEEAIFREVKEELGIEILTYSKSIGPVTIDETRFDAAEIMKNPLYMPDADAAAKAASYLEECKAMQNSAGGIIECVITGVPAGIGDPVFEKIDANLAKAIFSIGAVKGFEIGDGFAVAAATGLTNNDAFVTDEKGSVTKETNHAGGILGGMSDGSPIVFRAAIKPTPSVASTQKTVNKNGEEIEINIKGRHDPIIVPRAVVVVESMAAITILDAMLSNMSAQMDGIKDFYQK